MKTVLLLLVFGLLVSFGAGASVANRKARSIAEEAYVSYNSANTVTPSTSTGVPDQHLQKLYEFFQVIADAMKAQATGTEYIKSELGKCPVWDVIGHILNGTPETETTTSSPRLR